jgi:hypothetical protein
LEIRSKYLFLIEVGVCGMRYRGLRKGSPIFPAADIPEPLVYTKLSTVSFHKASLDIVNVLRKGSPIFPTDDIPEIIFVAPLIYTKLSTVSLHKASLDIGLPLFIASVSANSD